MAGLLLGDYNVLILDEPGNHLDVETVEALAEALIAYQGTVLFTSHDRHFVGRIATNVIEVRDGRARNYGGDYDAYLYAVNKEIDEGERERAQNRMSSAPADTAPTRPVMSGKEQHNTRRQVRNLEKKIAKLDDDKKELNARMLKTADAEAAMKLHTRIESLQKELAETENAWYELQVQLGEF